MWRFCVLFDVSQTVEQTLEWTVVVCFITKSFRNYSFFPPTPALSTIYRPLSSSMCSITQETANVGSSYNRMRGPGIGYWFSDRSNCSHCSLTLTFTLTSENLSLYTTLQWFETLWRSYDAMPRPLSGAYCVTGQVACWDNDWLDWCCGNNVGISCTQMYVMKTSSNGTIFRVTGPLCGGIPHTKDSDAELWCFFYLRLNKRLRLVIWDATVVILTSL